MRVRWVEDGDEVGRRGLCLQVWMWCARASEPYASWGFRTQRGREGGHGVSFGHRAISRSAGSTPGFAWAWGIRRVKRELELDGMGGGILLHVPKGLEIAYDLRRDAVVGTERRKRWAATVPLGGGVSP